MIIQFIDIAFFMSNTYSFDYEIVKDNPTITEEQFQIFKAACEAEVAKKKSKYMKRLQERNMGCHHLGSRGYGGKRSIWAKEDAEAASLGIPDPLQSSPSRRSVTSSGPGTVGTQ